MCDLGEYTKSFKGVVIERPMFFLLLALMYVTNISSMSMNLKDKSNHFDIDSRNGFPYCVYLESNKELDCRCQNTKDKLSSKHKKSNEAIPLANLLSGVESFKSINAKRTKKVETSSMLKKNGKQDNTYYGIQQVEKIKIHTCKALHLLLDFRLLPSPLYRLLIEDVENVKIDGLIIRSNETLDIWFRNINGSLTITGKMVCPGCLPYERISDKDTTNDHYLSNDLDTDSSGILKVEDERKPKVKLRIIEAGNVTFNSFVSEIGYPSNIRMQMRNAESVLIEESLFTELPPNGLEIFNVSNVTISHSQFYNGTSNSIVVNGGVKNVHVKNCLMDKHWLLPLDRNATDVYFRCTAPPTRFVKESVDYDMNDDPECVSTLSKWIDARHSGVQSTGAVVLAVVSAMILLIAIGFLFVLHRTGRLDRYI